jgi:hypothetical protein
MLGLVAKGGWGIVDACVTHNHVQYWCTGLGYHVVFMTLIVWLWQRRSLCVVITRLDSYHRNGSVM